jgi:TonB family protein
MKNTKSPVSSQIAWTRRAIKSLSLVGAAVVVAAASAANGAEVIVVAGAAPTSPGTSASTHQELLTVTALRGYDAGVFKEIGSVARYPNRPDASGARVQGKVTVDFRLDRQGTLQEATIVEPSRSFILNAAALRSVHVAKYDAFPADVVPGEGGRNYQVTFDYRLPTRD